MPRCRKFSRLRRLALSSLAMAAHLAVMPLSFAHDPKLDKSEGAEAIPVAFPVAIGGPFELVDHFGNTRSSGDFEGAYPLIFFGYAQCESICPVALRTMLDAVDLLTEDGKRLQPILITVDPEGEPPEVLRPAVEKLHPRLLGLTGTSQQIADVQKAFSVKSELVGYNLKGKAVLAHGSYIYLMGPDGNFLTLLPPILDAPTMAAKLKAYLS
jgi:protein SCO1/2